MDFPRRPFTELVRGVGIVGADGKVASRVDLPGPGLRPRVTALTAFPLTDRFRWSVASARFDYGFPGAFVPREERFAQVRLVLQPFGDFLPKGFAADASIHLLFDLAAGSQEDSYEGAVREIADTVAALKRDAGSLGVRTTGRPLGVHPAFLSPAAKEPFLRAANNRLLALLAKGTLSSAAVMVADNGVIPWVFFSGNVVDGRFEPIAQPFGDTFSLFESFAEFRNQLPVSKRGQAFPEFTDSRPQTNDYWTAAPGFGVLPLSERGRRSIGRIHDANFGGQRPGRADLETHLSCSTCHTATSRALTAREEVEIAFTPGEPGNRPTALVAEKAVQEQFWNVRNFGWFGGAPTVAIRTLNESLLVAMETNRLLGRSVEGTRCARPTGYLRCAVTRKTLPDADDACFVNFCSVR